MSRTRQGKIARLPFVVREEVCARLRDGEVGSQIVDWLNANHLPRGVDPINDENLSNWREGGYQDWLREQTRVDQIGKLSEYCLRLANKAGHSITDGAAAIAGGQILELLEAGESEDINELIGSLAKLRSSEAALLVARTAKDKVRQKDEDLNLQRDKFARETCVLFFKWFGDKRAREIAESTSSNAEKIAALRQLYFADIDALEQAGEVQIPK